MTPTPDQLAAGYRAVLALQATGSPSFAADAQRYVLAIAQAVLDGVPEPRKANRKVTKGELICD